MPINRMSRFEIFIGTWNTTGEVLATDDAPAAVLSATDTYRWLPGRQFIVHDVDARFGQAVSRSMEVMGYDKQAKKYFARSYDDQGVSEVFDIVLSGKKWSIFGATVRFNGKFDSRGNKLVGLWEMKSKKSGWQPWIELALVRA
jgi:uncharacterized protein DUF1579